jgi:HSP20 family protein
MAGKFDLIPEDFFKFPFRSLSRFPAFAEKGMLSSEGRSGLTVSSDKKNVYVKADLPGVESDAIDVTLDDGIVWIKGEKKEEKKDKDETFYRKSESSFTYSITLPEQVEEDQGDAEFDNGVLTITFPKSTQEKSKKISVKGTKKK